MSEANQKFWKHKLVALLHDPPDKCLDIRGHEDSARGFQVGAGLSDDNERLTLAQEVKVADHFASAAERFVFPRGKCATTFTGRRGETFVHPLSSAEYEIPGSFRTQAGDIHKMLKDAVGGIKTDDWRKRHFLYWRRWLENVVATDRQNAETTAFFPADTRIPDHSIWNHMAVTSAFAGCIEDGAVKPCLLLFQFGPVQDFIAQARSTRDLWSGSYMISWLMAHAMKAISDRVGPDAVVFPSLRGNGVFDALHREEMYATLYDDGKGGHDSLWSRMKEEKGAGLAAWLLSPTLPNRFLAVVPEKQAQALARSAEAALRGELNAIGEAVWSWVTANGGKAEWKLRWDAQLKAFPQIAWAIQPWLEREACLAEAESLPNKGPVERLKAMLVLSESVPDKDARYYEDGKLKQSGLLWSAHYALVDAKLAARRNTRDFVAWDPVREEAALKDSLSGKEECIGDKGFWDRLHRADDKLWPGAHRYGAMNLIKRLWCRPDHVKYLGPRLGLSDGAMREALGFDSVQDVATKGNTDRQNPYVAVLALDGDEMGKWVAGEKLPAFLAQLSAKARDYVRAVLKDRKLPEPLRLLTPSYHLQFSEALANYATHVVGEVVKAHKGQLVYAGGDDVLALLPASRAIECARALRSLFRGEQPEQQDAYDGLHVVQDGYVRSRTNPAVMAMPGENADVSVGLAVGHMKAPLQMLVRNAQRAEKRAKAGKDRGGHGRAAIAINVYKRSGEIIEWGAKWDAPALTLMNRITELTRTDQLSGRFPYALAGLLQPYALKGNGQVGDIVEIIQHEVRHVLGRQGAGLSAEERAALEKEIGAYLETTQDRIEDFINLFLVETFMNRQRGEN